MDNSDTDGSDPEISMLGPGAMGLEAADTDLDTSADKTLKGRDFIGPVGRAAPPPGLIAGAGAGRGADCSSDLDISVVLPNDVGLQPSDSEAETTTRKKRGKQRFSFKGPTGRQPPPPALANPLRSGSSDLNISVMGPGSMGLEAADTDFESSAENERKMRAHYFIGPAGRAAPPPRLIAATGTRKDADGIDGSSELDSSFALPNDMGLVPTDSEAETTTRKKEGKQSFKGPTGRQPPPPALINPLSSGSSLNISVMGPGSMGLEAADTDFESSAENERKMARYFIGPAGRAAPPPRLIATAITRTDADGSSELDVSITLPNAVDVGLLPIHPEAETTTRKKKGKQSYKGPTGRQPPPPILENRLRSGSSNLDISVPASGSKGLEREDTDLDTSEENYTRHHYLRRKKGKGGNFEGPVGGAAPPPRLIAATGTRQDDYGSSELDVSIALPNAVDVGLLPIHPEAETTTRKKKGKQSFKGPTGRQPPPPILENRLRSGSSNLNISVMGPGSMGREAGDTDLESSAENERKMRARYFIGPAGRAAPPPRPIAATGSRKDADGSSELIDASFALPNDIGLVPTDSPSLANSLRSGSSDLNTSVTGRGSMGLEAGDTDLESSAENEKKMKASDFIDGRAVSPPRLIATAITRTDADCSSELDVSIALPNDSEAETATRNKKGEQSFKGDTGQQPPPPTLENRLRSGSSDSDPNISLQPPSEGLDSESDLDTPTGDGRIDAVVPPPPQPPKGARKPDRPDSKKIGKKATVKVAVGMKTTTRNQKGEQSFKRRTGRQPPPPTSENRLRSGSSDPNISLQPASDTRHEALESDSDLDTPTVNGRIDAVVPPPPEPPKGARKPDRPDSKKIGKGKKATAKVAVGMKSFGFGSAPWGPRHPIMKERGKVLYNANLLSNQLMEETLAKYLPDTRLSAAQKKKLLKNLNKYLESTFNDLCDESPNWLFFGVWSHNQLMDRLKDDELLHPSANTASFRRLVIDTVGSQEAARARGLLYPNPGRGDIQDIFTR